MQLNSKVYVNFLIPAKTLKKYGSWALVTGPTDGIGKGFAFQLARKGINMILVGQNLDKLKDVSDSIQAKYSKTHIKIVVVDFTDDISESVQRISEAMEGLDVGVVINNVGISYPYARYLHEVDEEHLKNLIKMNVEAMVLGGGQGAAGAMAFGGGRAPSQPPRPKRMVSSHSQG